MAMQVQQGCGRAEEAPAWTAPWWPSWTAGALHGRSALAARARTGVMMGRHGSAAAGVEQWPMASGPTDTNQLAGGRLLHMAPARRSPSACKAPCRLSVYRLHLLLILLVVLFASAEGEAYCILHGLTQAWQLILLPAVIALGVQSLLALKSSGHLERHALYIGTLNTMLIRGSGPAVLGCSAHSRAGLRQHGVPHQPAGPCDCVKTACS